MKKLFAILLAIAMLLSIAACGGKEPAATEGNLPETTSASEQEAAKPNAEGGKSIELWYGSGHYEGHTSTFYCPEGAYIDEADLAEYEAEGPVMSFTVYDDVREYQAYAENHWSRDLYTEDPEVYELTPQLYFYGELDEYNAAEYENCSQTVTDLGFQWEGKDVMLLETHYTLPGYSEQVELFVCVEVEERYWRTKDGGGTEENLVAPILLGFELSSWNELTADQCAWIAGQLFGVDSGRTWPLEGEEETEAPVVNVAASELLGTWLQRDSDWDDTYIFNADGTGKLISGPEYPFTYTVNGDILTLTYDEDDEEEFTISVDGDLLTMIDKWGEELLLDKQAEEVSEPENDQTEATEPAEPTLEELIIGTWVSEADGETYVFNADGTGYQIYEGITYEYTYTIDGDYVEIFYVDYDPDAFDISIEGDTLTIAYNWTYTRQ